MGFMRNFSAEVRKWGLWSACKIYFDLFLNFAELKNRPYLKPLQFVLARIVFAYQIRLAVPVFVFQMGKVGSTSIYTNLVRFHAGVVAHSHNFLKDDPRYQIRRLYRWAVIEKKPINIISLVREPISRNISALFQNYERDMGIPFDGERISFEKLKEVLLSQYNLGHTRWFERRIQSIFGLDVYATPFPQSGFATFSRDNVRLLVVRSELSNNEKETVIKEFLGLKKFQIINANVGAEKDYAGQYRKFKSMLRLPADYVNMLCDSKFARHFYPSDVIEAVRSSWNQSSN